MYCFVRFQKGLGSVFDESFQHLSLYSNQFTLSLTKHIPEESLSIDENRMKIRAVVFEFIVCRQTDRQARRRTLFYNMYR